MRWLFAFTALAAFPAGAQPCFTLSVTENLTLPGQTIVKRHVTGYRILPRRPGDSTDCAQLSRSKPGTTFQLAQATLQGQAVSSGAGVSARAAIASPEPKNQGHPYATWKLTAEGGAVLEFEPSTIPPDDEGFTGACDAQRYEPFPFRFLVSKDDLAAWKTLHRSLRLTMPLGPNECTGNATVELSSQLHGKGPQLRIAGPGCLCDETAWTFTATAEGGDGTGQFLPFEVEGPARPSVVRNEGGKTATIELSGKADEVGPVRLIAVFSEHGELTRSDAFNVSFLGLEVKPRKNAWQVADGDYAFDDRKPGKLEVAVEHVRAWKDRQRADADVTWTDEKGDGLLAKSERRGTRTVFLVEGLPEHNRAFGPRSLRATLSNGSCSCEASTQVRLFFLRDAKNGPKPEQPNWASYWAETKAGRSLSNGAPISFVAIEPIPPPKLSAAAKGTIARYEPVGDVLYLSYLGAPGKMSACCPRAKGGARDEGIDCFASTLNHEQHHREQLISWWGVNLVDYPCLNGFVAGVSVVKPDICAVDEDMDFVPTGVELRTAGCNPKQAVSCSGMPLWCGGLTDLEHSAYAAGWAWKVGAANAEDWACPGKQCSFE